MNLLKSLTGPKKREASGVLSGRTFTFGEYTIKAEGVLGEGGFATIYRAVDVNTQAIYALKHFMLSGDPDAERDVHTEVAVMRALSNCPHVLALHSAAMGTGSAFLLLDYCDGTLAAHMMSRGSSLSNNEVTGAFLPIARAIAAIHNLSPPMAHRDVKAENVLLRTDGNWVLCDFGSCTKEQKIYSSAQEIAQEEERIRKHTTPAYRAPELWDLYSREFIGTAVDVWSLGCLLYLIAYGKLPFDGEAKLQILNGKYSVPPGRPAGVEQLIADMLVVDPKKRITAAEVAERAARMMSSTASSTGGGGERTSGARRSSSSQAAPAAPAPSTTSAVQQQSSNRGRRGDSWGREFENMPTAAAVGQQTSSLQQQTADEGGWANFGSDSALEAMATAAPPQIPAPAPASAPPSRPVSRTSTTSTTGGVNNTSRSSSRPSSRQGERERDRNGSLARNSLSETEYSRSGRSSSASAVYPPAAAAGGPAVAPVAAPAVAPTAELKELKLESSELQENCRVLEQLLEDRNKEVAMLRAELKKKDNEVAAARRFDNTPLDGHSVQLAKLQRVAAAAEAEMDRVKEETASSIAVLRGELELYRVRACEAEAELDRLRQERRSGGSSSGGSSRGGNANRPSSSGNSDSSRRVNSFRVPIESESALSPRQERGGIPMRPGGSAPAPRVTSQKLPQGVSGRQDSFFKDLNPLK